MGLPIMVKFSYWLKYNALISTLAWGRRRISEVGYEPVYEYLWCCIVRFKNHTV